MWWIMPFDKDYTEHKIRTVGEIPSFLKYLVKQKILKEELV